VAEPSYRTGDQPAPRPGSPAAGRPRRGPDVLTLLMGLISLVAACMALFQWTPPLPLLDPRWLLAGAAVLVGLLLFAASVRPPRNR
jgi:uncharacterized membrane protein HdeD (DUF308 family)